MSPASGISLLVHTRDVGSRLPTLLASTEWCDERVIVDMASTDDTVELAKAAGCRVIGIDAEPFTDLVRNRFLREPEHVWTLVLDADEYLASDAEMHLRALAETAAADVSGFALPRFNRIAGQILTGPVWYPDHQVRLFRRDSIRYLPGHHRRPEPVDGRSRVVDVDPDGGVHIHHDNYDSIGDVIERQVRYALTDVYDPDPHRFDFQSHLDEAERQFESRLAVEQDGAVSYALAVLMQWDQIVRGLLHWEASGRSAPLTVAPPPSSRLPMSMTDPRRATVGTRSIADLEEEILSLRHQIDAIRRSRSMAVTAPLRAIANLIRSRSR